MNKITDDLLELAMKTIQINIDCFIAQWILQNPDVSIEDYSMCYGIDAETGWTEFYMKKLDK